MPVEALKDKSREDLGRGQVEELIIKSGETSQSRKVIGKARSRASGGLAKPNMPINSKADRSQQVNFDKRDLRRGQV